MAFDYSHIYKGAKLCATEATNNNDRLKNIATVFLFLASAINALQIVLPLAQSTIISVTSFTLQVNTGPLLGETDGSTS